MRLVPSVLIVALLTGCATQEARDRWLLAGAAVSVAALAYYAGKNGGGGTAPASSDWDWDWDQIYNQYGQLVWMCRGIQTTQFAESARCAYKPQTDLRWPGK